MYGRVMSWVAMDRGLRLSERRGRPADVERWRRTRDQIYDQVMEKGWNKERAAFVQHYGSDVLDASNLLMPLVGFIAPRDPMWLSTLDAIDDELVSDSLVYRYDPSASPDGLRGSEGVLHLHVLVRRRARPLGPTRAGTTHVREDAHVREPPRAVLGGDRPDRRAARELPAGVHAPFADQCCDESGLSARPRSRLGRLGLPAASIGREESGRDGRPCHAGSIDGLATTAVGSFALAQFICSFAART